jgi:membrane associated rhomboid family serine protease
MIPIRDDAPRYSTPYITYTLLALNIIVFLFELSLPGSSRAQFMYQFGMLPTHVTGALVGVPGVSFAGAFIPIITSMFLHASWMHLIFNMLFLHIFGDNIEDYLGHFRFLVFYLLTGLAAALAHILMNPTSNVPSVGASGAIAGVMGAYFVLYPSARVLTLVPFFFVFFVWLPAWVMLGYWFVGQFLAGAATAIAYASQTSGGGVAFWAHVGGFVAGLAMIKLFPTRPRRYRYF